MISECHITRSGRNRDLDLHHRENRSYPTPENEQAREFHPASLFILGRGEDGVKARQANAAMLAFWCGRWLLLSLIEYTGVDEQNVQAEAQDGDRGNLSGELGEPRMAVRYDSLCSISVCG